MIENKEQKFFLQLMRKDTISGTTKLYPRPSFIQDLYLCRLHDIKKTTYFTGYADGSMPFVDGDDRTDALKALEQIAKISQMVFK